MDCSLPGSSVPGTSQARILEWVAISFSRESSPPMDETCVSCIGRRILYHWATCKAHPDLSVLDNYKRDPSNLGTKRADEENRFPLRTSRFVQVQKASQVRLLNTLVKEPLAQTSLVVQGLIICTSTAEGAGLMPNWGTNILQAMWWGQKKRTTGMKPLVCLSAYTFPPHKTAQGARF